MQKHNEEIAPIEVGVLTPHTPHEGLYTFMEEIWKPTHIESEFYEVSNMGQVRVKDRLINIGAWGGTELRKGKILSKVTDIRGYHKVVMRIDGKPKKVTVHKLVSLAFIPNEHNKPAINHIDGDKTNNRVSNLEWVTNKENTHHAWDNGLMSNFGVNHAMSVLSEAQVLEIYNSDGFMKDIGKKYGVSAQTVSSIKKGKTWNHITNAI